MTETKTIHFNTDQPNLNPKKLNDKERQEAADIWKKYLAAREFRRKLFNWGFEHGGSETQKALRTIYDAMDFDISVLKHQYLVLHGINL